MNYFYKKKTLHFPLNKLKSKELYFYFFDKLNHNKVHSMFFFKNTKQINKIKTRIKALYFFFNKFNILTHDFYPLQYTHIKKVLYKVDIKKNIIILKNNYVFKFKKLNIYILLVKYLCF